MKGFGVAPKGPLVPSQAVLTLYNDEAFSVTFANMTYWKDNDIANYTLDNFATPTGTSMSLADEVVPGNSSVDVPLGAVNPADYQLVLGTVVETLNPSFQFGFGIADDLQEVAPEPGSLAEFSLGTMVVAAIATIRRMRTSRSNISSLQAPRSR
jgi:hypothetical protein